MSRPLVSPDVLRKDWSTLSQLPLISTDVGMLGSSPDASCRPPETTGLFLLVAAKDPQLLERWHFKSHLTLIFHQALWSTQQQWQKLIPRSHSRTQRFQKGRREPWEGRRGRKWSTYFSCWSFLSCNFTYSRTVQFCSKGWETHCELLNLVNYKVIGKTQWKPGFAP